MGKQGISDCGGIGCEAEEARFQSGSFGTEWRLTTKLRRIRSSEGRSGERQQAGRSPYNLERMFFDNRNGEVRAHPKGCGYRGRAARVRRGGPPRPTNYSESLRDSTPMMSGLVLMAAWSSLPGSVLSWMRQQAAAAPSKMMFWTSSMLVLARRIWSITWASTPTRS